MWFLINFIPHNENSSHIGLDFCCFSLFTKSISATQSHSGHSSPVGGLLFRQPKLLLTRAGTWDNYWHAGPFSRQETALDQFFFQPSHGQDWTSYLTIHTDPKCANSWEPSWLGEIQAKLLSSLAGLHSSCLSPSQHVTGLWYKFSPEEFTARAVRNRDERKAFNQPVYWAETEAQIDFCLPRLE